MRKKISFSRSLNRLQLIQELFILWILLGGIWGYFFPDLAAAGRPFIPQALGVIMLGMGLTITTQQLKSLRNAGKLIILGVLLQFTVMPLLGWLLATLLGLPPMLALGVILVGAAPGGTASNVITFLAGGNVALSVALTTASTLLSPIVTPLWIWVLSSTWLEINPISLFFTVVKIVLFPVLAGIFIRRFCKIPPLLLNEILPLISMAVIVWIVAIVIGLNHQQLFIAPLVIITVVIHNSCGLLFGYFGAKHISVQSENQARTIAIEVGMQNSGLAVSLAMLHFEPVAALSGAIYSVWHNLTGAMLAAYWRKNN